MVKANREIRIEVLKSGLSYKEIAAQMGIGARWLSCVMAKELTPEMKQRIMIAIDELTISRIGGVKNG